MSLFISSSEPLPEIRAIIPPMHIGISSGWGCVPITSVDFGSLVTTLSANCPRAYFFACAGVMPVSFRYRCILLSAPISSGVRFRIERPLSSDNSTRRLTIHSSAVNLCGFSKRCSPASSSSISLALGCIWSMVAGTNGVMVPLPQEATTSAFSSPRASSITRLARRMLPSPVDTANLASGTLAEEKSSLFALLVVGVSFILRVGLLKNSTISFTVPGESSLYFPLILSNALTTEGSSKSSSVISAHNSG